MTAFVRADGGSAAVELAMMVPVWTLVITTMIQIALIYQGAALDRHAAARAARSAVVVIPTAEPNEPANRVGAIKLARIRQVAVAALGEIAAATPDVDARLELELDGGEREPGGDLRFEATAPVAVTVRYRMPLIVPLAGRLLGDADPAGGRTWTLTTTATMLNEGLARRPGGGS